MQTTCSFDQNLLRAFERGDLADHSFELVAEHVETCTACQSLLDVLNQEAHSLTARLRVLQASEVSIIPNGYELLEIIGTGGMGVVYRARDVRLNREVAIKLIHERYCSQQTLAERFAIESQITGQLQHPGIPAVYELGQLPNGRPFLAMKLVKGQTLSDLLKERPNLVHDRGWFIAIFEQVCHAVGYAHAHQVIHRDLKPANVMVGAHGEVQVMDWGLAKLLDDSNARQQQMPDNPEASRGRSTAITTSQQSDFATRTGSVLGTLAYMPPEQADGAIHKLDARSDVFGLGAILCQILTGQPPYRSSDANELFQLAQRGDVAVAFAALDSCGADPELVTLCKRCLALNQKDRPMDGREVAIEVARLRRAAEERARQAELELALAIVREREQRNRRRLWFGLAASLLVGMITSLGFALWAEYTRRQAVEANTLAQRQLNQIEKDAQLIAGIFSDVDLDELEEEGKPLKLVFADRFEKVAHELDTEAVSDPLILAKLQTTLGNSLLSFGRPKLASILLEKALTVRMQGLGTNHPDTLLTMNSLATAYKDDHQYEKAIPLFEETLKRTQTKLGRNHPDVLTLMNNLAQVYQEVGKLDRAIPLHEETLRLRQENLGRENRHTLFSMSNLALAYHVSGRLHDALPLSEECLRLRSQMLGRQHPETLTSINNLAGLYKDLKRFDEAVKLYTEALELREKMLGSHHPLTLTTKHNLASAYYFFGKPEKALPHFEEVYRLRKASLKAEHPDNVNSLLCLIWVYLECQRADDATPLIKEYVTLLRQQYGAESSQFAAETTVLARMLLQAGKSAEAEAYLRECLAIRQKLQPDAWSTFYTQSLLGEALLGQKQYVEAESLLLSGYAGMKERTLSIPPQSKHRLTEAVDRLITLYTAIDKPDQAKKWQAEKEKLP